MIKGATKLLHTKIATIDDNDKGLIFKRFSRLLRNDQRPLGKSIKFLITKLHRISDKNIVRPNFYALLTPYKK